MDWCRFDLCRTCFDDICDHLHFSEQKLSKTRIKMCCLSLKRKPKQCLMYVHAVWNENVRCFNFIWIKKNKSTMFLWNKNYKTNVNIYRFKIYWIIYILRVIICLLISTFIISNNPSLSVLSSSELIGLYLYFQHQYWYYLKICYQ